MKIHITDTTEIGKKCKLWAIANSAAIETNYGVQYEIVENPEDAEFFFSVFYNKIVSPEFLKARKCFNFHGGILPDYRGSGTLNFAILNNEETSGITLHEMNEIIDGGNLIAIEKFPILEKDTTQDLFVKAENAILILFKEWFPKLLLGKYEAIPQRGMSKIYTRADLQKAKDITRYVRAFHTAGYEQAYYFNSKGEKIYLKW